MVDMASIAESFKATQVGLGVITFEMLVEQHRGALQPIDELMSVSVMFPASPPALLTTSDASPRLLASIWVTERTVSFTDEISGFFGCSFETARENPQLWPYCFSSIELGGPGAIK
jgi:hypothetical protein